VGNRRGVDGRAPLNSEQIDNIIAAAPERARRIEWDGVLENAACFTAGLEG
jgi:hypothetical protein